MSLTGIVRPYGDTTGDGRVQLSFTLPVPFGDEAERARAEGAALQLAAKMGMDPAMVVHAKGMGPDFTFFIVYGRVSHLIRPGVLSSMASGPSKTIFLYISSS